MEVESFDISYTILFSNSPHTSTNQDYTPWSQHSHTVFFPPFPSFFRRRKLKRRFIDVKTKLLNKQKISWFPTWLLFSISYYLRYQHDIIKSEYENIKISERKSSSVKSSLLGVLMIYLEVGDSEMNQRMTMIYKLDQFFIWHKKKF